MSIRQLVRHASYPVIVLGGAASVLAAMTIGVGYWPLVPAVLVMAAALVAALERAVPYAPAWNVDDRDTRLDVLHLVGNVGLGQLSLAVFAALRPVWSGAGVWPSGAPLWAQALLALVIIDLGLYAVHRASHASAWLWRLHAIHHSPRRVYWMNGQRRHLLHELLEGAPGLAVLFIAGAPAIVVAAAVALVTLHLLLQHANIDYRLGPFRALFAVAELHRWHHQRAWRAVQGNYAAVFAVWDRLFGTALPWRGDAPPDVGISDEPVPPGTYVGQLVWPFRRAGGETPRDHGIPL